MAIQFQYNKTSLQQLQRQLRIRERALPTLKNKESALRAEVKKAKHLADSLEEKLQHQMEERRFMARLWDEFDPSLLQVSGVETNTRKIAGIQIPVLAEIRFEEPPYSLFNAPHWFPDGIDLLKSLLRIAIEKEFALRSMALLDHARKKTTQKVNLYEKVQIPGYEEAIRKVKRFLEDKENLAKAAQKIVKNRQSQKKKEETL